MFFLQIYSSVLFLWKKTSMEKPLRTIHTDKYSMFTFDNLEANQAPRHLGRPDGRSGEGMRRRGRH